MADFAPIRVEGGRRVNGGPLHSQPIVTIIIAVLNGETTLERAIKSVVTQDFRSIEFVIIDGGSSDGTGDILSKYEKDIDCWVSEVDGGIYEALNKGLALATGEWIYFLGCDDSLVGTDVISKVFSLPRNTKLIYGDVIHGDPTIIYGGLFTKRRMVYENICQQCVFYRRDLFDIIGGFNCKYRLLADWAFNMEAFVTVGVNPVHLNQVIADYSLGGASTTIVDKAFAEDRLGLIFKYFGIGSYLFAINIMLKAQIIANFKKYVVRPLYKLAGSIIFPK